MSSRTYCPMCNYPVKTCVCAVVKKINNHSTIDIIQHPSEAKQAKNTVRLCQLCLNHLSLWRGESHSDFIQLQQSLKTEKRQIIVVYPQNNVQSIDSFEAQHEQGFRFIFLDGTWKKVYKLWQLNPWLRQYPGALIDNIEPRYTIRKAPKPGQLSTLEAISITLNRFEPRCNTDPLLNCLRSLIKTYQFQ